jgi:hypothetical protein
MTAGCCEAVFLYDSTAGAVRRSLFMTAMPEGQPFLYKKITPLKSGAVSRIYLLQF